MLLVLCSVFILFSNERIFSQQFKFSLSSPQKFVEPVGIEKKEPSAIASIENGAFLLIADDKCPALLVVSREKDVDVSTTSCDAKDSTCINFPKSKDPTCKNFHESDEKPKWEAMAQDGDDFYIIGAHQNTDKDTKVFLSFKIRKETKSKFIIHSVVKFEIENVFLPTDGSNPQIEGLAIRKINGKKELIIGIRNRDVDDPEKTNAERKIFVRKIELSDNNSGKFRVQPFFNFDPEHSKKDSFRFHLASIEYIPQLKGFLIVTSTEKKPGNNFFGNALWFMSDENIDEQNFNPIKITKDDFEPNMKAEGLSLLSNSGKYISLSNRV